MISSFFGRKTIGFRFSISLSLFMLLLTSSTSVKAGGNLGEALYFSFQATSPLPSSPSSLLVQSPSYIKVPAGSVLTVHLLNGDNIVSTSTLEFLQGYDNERLIPPVPVASFVNTGSAVIEGQPLPGSKLTPGEADLGQVASKTADYRLLWILSSGVMGTPGKAVATGAPVSFVDLTLTGVSAATVVGDQKPGSILFFNRYTSSASNSIREDSRLNLTNTNLNTSIFVRLFMVNSATCETIDFGLCLAARQTISVQLSDLDPGVKGYVVAVATDAQGIPIQFNWLIGNMIVKQSAANISGSFTAVLSALAIARRSESPATTSGGTAYLFFDDINYERLPSQVAFDSVPTQFNAANATTMSVYRPISNLNGGASATTAQISAWGRDSENQLVSSSGSVAVSCYNDIIVSLLRLSPATVAQLLPPGSSAWFAASSTGGTPLMGSLMNSGEYNGGGNARPLTLASSYRIDMPIKAVACTQ